MGVEAVIRQSGSFSFLIGMNHSTEKVPMVVVQLENGVWRLLAKLLPVGILHVERDSGDISKFPEHHIISKENKK